MSTSDEPVSPANETAAFRPTTTPPPTRPLPGPPPLPGVRYRIVRRHARGGLGEVFVAEDTELGRHVALKEIQARHADHPESRARFILEAEITGGLEHPGIVPIYGLGTHPDGRPFYAMRFIQGDDLRAAIKRFHGASVEASARRESADSLVGLTPRRSPGFDSLEFRQLLRRFVDVCNAVAYAHSRGVLHRDLKPANVMLGKFGETLVVDWGLAKVQASREPQRSDDTATDGPVQPRSGDSSAATVMGQTLGTPAYMSPEQAGGRLDDLGPTSDIYSLGATLYEMLTGRVPFPEVDLDAIQDGRFPAPRMVNAAVPLPLDAVCRKAMALHPANRYVSAQALAADVEHWLADEPVTAWREPVSVRAWRWVRRHRTAAVAAAVLVAATAAGLGLLALERERARGAVAAERDEKERQRKEAQTERDRAVAARARTREALDAMTSRVTGQSLATQPALSDEQRRFLRSVLTYYEEFAAEPGEDRDGAERLAKAHVRLGIIHERLGQRAEAAAVLRRSVGLYERLANDHPNVVEYRRQLAHGHSNLGVLFAALGRRTEAIAEYRAALAGLGGLAADAAADPDYRRLLAQAHNNLGLLLAGMGKRSEAETAYKAALSIRERLVTTYPDVPEFRQDQAQSFNNLGNLLDTLGRGPEAEAAHRSALALRERLSAEAPAIADHRRDLGQTYTNLGILLRSLGRRAEAEAAHRAALAAQERLTADYPGVTDYAVDLGANCVSLGDLFRGDGDFAAALPWFDRAIKTLAPIHAAEPRQIQVRQFLRNAHWSRAAALTRQRRLNESESDWNRAVALTDAVHRTGVRVDRAAELARAGESERAIAAAEELAVAPGATAGTIYDAACVCAIAGAGDRAMALLRRAVEHGYANVPHLLKDADLDPLRRRADYAELLWDLADK